MSRRGFEARLLPDLDLGEYDSLAHNCGSIFNTVAWTDLFGKALSRFGIYDAGGTLRGGFCFFRLRRFGMTVLRNPIATPEIGPFFSTRAEHPVAKLEESRDILTAVADALDGAKPAVVSVALSPRVSDCLPFYWRGYKVTPGYTYLLDLAQSEDEVLRGMKSEHRNRLRSVRRDGLAVRLEADYGVVRELVRDTFRRQGLDLAAEYLDRLLDSVELRRASYACATYQGDSPIACAYVIHDARVAYYLLGGLRSDCGHTGAGVAAMFAAIMHARKIGLKFFDFEGSVIPRIERYFRFFGGRLTHYFRLSKAWLPVEMALKPIKRQLF